MTPSRRSLDDILNAHSAALPGGRSTGSPTGKVSDQQFAASKHQYTDPRTGKRLTSVTSVVGTFDSGDKLGRGARAAVAIERAGGDYQKEWDGKRDVGSRVHNYADLWMHGKAAEVPEEDGQWMDSFAEWCNANNPEWLYAERAGVGYAPCLGGPCLLCNGTGQIGYGGRFDAIGAWDDLFWLSDYKTGRAYRPELTIQLAGYANFDGMIVYNEEGMAVDLEPMPHIDRWAGLYIREDGCELVECPDPGKASDDWTLEEMQHQAFQTFTGLLYVKEWAKQINRKGA